MREVFIIRLAEGRRRWWVVADGDRSVSGKVGESKDRVLGKWLAKFGSEGMRFTRFKGALRPSEAAMTLASAKMEWEEEQKKSAVK